MSHPAFTSQPQSITALWPVLISHFAELAWVDSYIPRYSMTEDGHPS